MKRIARIAMVAAATVVLCASVANATAWKFGVMSDTQWKSNLDGQNPNTVAVGIINQLNTQFINNGVDFVVQVGDLCDSNGTNNAGLQTRLDATSALTSNGIEFYGLRGNHESSSTSQTFFQNNYIPKNTTDAAVALAPDVTSYSVTYKDTKLVLLDIGVTSNTTVMDTATTWMDNQLSADDHNQAFVFGHKNLLGQNHKDNIFGSSNDANPIQQNAFISSLDKNNVEYYISGHDHMHNRSIVTSPDGLSSVEQLICASDSYKFYTPTTPFSTRNEQISQELYTIGYYIFTVDGGKVNVDFYSSDNGFGPIDVDLKTTPSLNFTLKESYGYNLNNTVVPEPSSILAMLSGLVGVGGMIIKRKK